MEIEICDRLAELPASDWNRLIDDGNPFLRHEFLAALEETGCVSPATGWQPQHLLARSADRRLLGAVPLYLKYHSYGEYVFDWAWANAYHQAGHDYYPKLVAAVPFTPVSGQRLLVAADADYGRTAGRLIEAARALARRLEVSSMHWLFCRPRELELLAERAHLRRSGYQFHWHNRGYRSFADFLAALSAKKRKNIRQERRAVIDAGVRFEIVTGDAATPALWEQFYAFYHDTIRNHGAIPYLNLDFFQAIGAAMPESVVLVLARHGGDYVAGALNLRDRQTLYGRYWGNTRNFDKLHFETCYYQAIEFCIDHDLETFEAGAQGRHKLARGLLPSPTHSAHWLGHPEFNRAIANYLQHERSSIDYDLQRLTAHSPFRTGGPAS